LRLRDTDRVAVRWPARLDRSLDPAAADRSAVADGPVRTGACISGAGSIVATSDSPALQSSLRYAVAPPSPLHLWTLALPACRGCATISAAPNITIHFIIDAPCHCRTTRIAAAASADNRLEALGSVGMCPVLASGFPDGNGGVLTTRKRRRVMAR